MYQRRRKSLFMRLICLLFSFIYLLLFALVVTILPDISVAVARDRVAILDFKVAKTEEGEMASTTFEAQALTEALRASITELNLFLVMTKENMYELLEPGVDLEDCIGKCEVETGRNMGAKYILTGVIGRLNGHYDLVIKLFNTKTGEFLSSKSVSGENIDTVRTRLPKIVRLMFSGVSMREAMGVSDEAESTLLFLSFIPRNDDVRVIIDDRYIDLEDQRVRKQKEGFLIPIKPDVKHKIKVAANGYITSNEELLVSRGGVGNLFIQLAPVVENSEICDGSDNNCLADLFIYTKPSGASVYIDGKLITHTPNTPKLTQVTSDPSIGQLRVRIMPGEHVIEARKNGYLSSQRRVKLKRGDFNKDLESKPLALIPNFGKLRVTTKPKFASFELDGKVVASQSPLQLVDLKVGAHRLKVRSPDHQVYEELVVIERGLQTSREIQLTPDYSHLLISLIENGAESTVIASALCDLENNKGQSKRYLFRFPNLACL
jgi:hypothetical protein